MKMRGFMRGGIGFLVGVGLVLWVKPTNAGGTGILIVIPIVIGMVIGGIVAKLMGNGDEGDRENR
jgi:ascorbate-specific PTS system EIIC-type component UlaA